jgi:DNA-binding transcriptional LysR family regulator
MEIRDLEYFVAVAHSGSFTRAARDMFISQSSLSAAVRRLEHTLDVELFERTQQGAQLTASGRFFLQRAEAILGKCVQPAHTPGWSTAPLNCATCRHWWRRDQSAFSLHR